MISFIFIFKCFLELTILGNSIGRMNLTPHITFNISLSIVGETWMLLYFASFLSQAFFPSSATSKSNPIDGINIRGMHTCTKKSCSIKSKIDLSHVKISSLVQSIQPSIQGINKCHVTYTYYNIKIYVYHSTGKNRIQIL